MYRGRLSGITCKQCGARSLHWDDSMGSWRLKDAYDNPHKCKFTLEEVLEVMVTCREMFKKRKEK